MSLRTIAAAMLIVAGVLDLLYGGFTAGAKSSVVPFAPLAGAVALMVAVLVLATGPGRRVV